MGLFLPRGNDLPLSDHWVFVLSKFSGFRALRLARHITSQGQILAHCAAKLPSSDLNFAVDFWMDFWP